MQFHLPPGSDGQFLLFGIEAGNFDRNPVLADGDGVEMEFASAVGSGGLRPVGVQRNNGNLRGLHWAVLRVMHKPRHRTEYRGRGTARKYEQAPQQSMDESFHRSSTSVNGKAAHARFGEFKGQRQGNLNKRLCGFMRSKSRLRRARCM